MNILKDLLLPQVHAKQFVVPCLQNIRGVGVKYVPEHTELQEGEKCLEINPPASLEERQRIFILVTKRTRVQWLEISACETDRIER